MEGGTVNKSGIFPPLDVQGTCLSTQEFWDLFEAFVEV